MLTLMFFPIIMFATIASITIYFILSIMMTFFIVAIQAVLTATLTTGASIVTGIGGSFFLPKYLKKAIEIIRNDKEAVLYIKKKYAQLIKPVVANELITSIIMLIALGVSFYALSSDKNIGIGLLLLSVLAIFSFFDLFKKIKNLFGFLDNNRKKMFINFLYEIYKQYPEYAKEIYYSFKNHYKLSTAVGNLKNLKFDDKFLDSLSEITQKSMEAESQSIKNATSKYERFIVNGVFPKSEKEQLKMIFSILMNNFDLGIKLIEKAKNENLSIVNV